MQGLKPGGNDYLTKPVNREELAVRIKNLSDLKKAIKKNNEISQKLLQKRMTPHFIFNTLNSIHSYMHFDIEKADDALMQLAHCFRFLTNNSFESLITFDDEWEFAQQYLKIKKLQHEDVLTVNINVEGNFDDINIPPLIIQPLIENAFKHGFYQRRSDWNLVVDVVRTDKRVRLSVKDNGSGVPENVDVSRSTENIIKRMNYYFKNVELTIENAENGGAETLLTFEI